MKSTIALALVFAASPMLAQQTGVAHPPDTSVEDLPPAASVPGAIHSTKPSAAIPENEDVAPQSSHSVSAAADADSKAPLAMPRSAAQEVYQPYRPAVTLHSRAENPVADPDATIVTEVPRSPNELPVGTAIRARLRNEVATEITQPNTPFVADLTENVMTDGHVLLPAGSTIEGMVTQVRGGRRIRGAALIHLQAQTVILPDGTRVPLYAQVIDTDQYADTKVDEEGNILRKDHAGATLAAMSLATGGAAAAGGVIGGAPGALVGAAVGAGVSTVWWLKQDRQTHLPKDTLLVLGLTAPLQISGTFRPQDFSTGPAPATMTSRASQAAVPAPSPYVAPQAFVPMN